MYVRCFHKGDVSDISSRGRLGLFGINATALQSIGLSRGTLKVELDGNLVALPKLFPPLTLKRFLSSPKIQLKAFTSLQEKAMKRIQVTGLDSRIGSDVGGETLTLSGLLGLTSQAGIKGAQSWLDDPSERQRYPYTTSIFLKTNGIF